METKLTKEHTGTASACYCGKEVEFDGSTFACKCGEINAETNQQDLNALEMRVGTNSFESPIKE